MLSTTHLDIEYDLFSNKESVLIVACSKLPTGLDIYRPAAVFTKHNGCAKRVSKSSQLGRIVASESI